MPQAEFRESARRGLVGMRVNMEEWNTITRTNTGAARIGFGVPVQRSGEHGCVELSAGEFIGISEKAVTTIGGDSYAQYDSVPVMNSGVIWGMAGGACTVGGKVYFNTTTKTYSNTNTDVEIVGAEFEHNATSGNEVGIRLVRVPS